MDEYEIHDKVQRLVESFLNQEAGDSVAPAPGSYSNEIITLSALQEQLVSPEEIVDRGELVGWRSVERLYRPTRGQWTVVHGIPGHGKTSWVDCMMINLIARSKWKFAVFSAENQPVLRHARWLITKFAGLEWEDISKEEKIYSIKKLDESISILNPDEKHLSLDYILDLAWAVKADRGLDGLVIDPWNEVDHSGRKAGETETEYISRALSKIRRFARKHHIHIWVVAHPMKLMRGKDGKYPVPSLYDISGSAAWRAKCDFGICVWRDLDNVTKPTNINVQKVRYPENGFPGTAYLDFNRSVGKYEDNLKFNPQTCE